MVNLLAIWRAQGLDVILREAWQAGVVLAGLSAGLDVLVRVGRHAPHRAAAPAPRARLAAGLELRPPRQRAGPPAGLPRRGAHRDVPPARRSTTAPGCSSAAPRSPRSSPRAPRARAYAVDADGEHALAARALAPPGSDAPATAVAELGRLRLAGAGDYRSPSRRRPARARGRRPPPRPAPCRARTAGARPGARQLLVVGGRDGLAALVAFDHAHAHRTARPQPSARSRLNAALISARWVKACGKLPSCSPVGPICSE